MAIESAQHRLPSDFTSAVDPVDGNPFTPEDPRHAAWASATRIAEEELHRSHAGPVPVLPATTSESVNFFWNRALLPALDAWARRGLSAIASERDVQQYGDWLHRYLNSWLDELARYFEWREPPFPAEVVLLEVRRRFVRRTEFWKAEACHRLGEIESRAREAAATASPVTPELIARRKRLVSEFRTAKDLSMVAFSRSVGLSSTAIRGMIHEDKTRFAAAKQSQLLKALGVTRAKWYGA
jgi:hypothetical protein